MSSLSCFFFHFFILSKVKFIKKIETLHQFPQLRGSAKCLHFIIMLISRIKPRRLNRRMMALATSLYRQSSQAHQQEHEEHP